MNSSLWMPASVLRRQRGKNKDIESRMAIEKRAKHEKGLPVKEEEETRKKGRSREL